MILEQVKPIILRSGKLSLIDSSIEELVGSPDYHSGYSSVSVAREITHNKQSINFTMLTLDDALTLDGDLWLA